MLIPPQSYYQSVPGEVVFHTNGLLPSFASNGIEAVKADTSVTVNVGGCDFEDPAMCGWIQVRQPVY